MGCRVWLLSMACSSFEGSSVPFTPTATEPAHTDTVAAESGHTSTERAWSYLDLEWATFGASFVFDAATGSIVDLQTDYGAIPGAIEIRLGSGEWAAAGFDPARTDLYCVVQLVLGGGDVPSWVSKDADLWYGTEYAGGPAWTNCNEQVDPFLWPDDLAAELGGLPGWGVAVGLPSPEVASLIAEWPPEDQGTAFGGRIQNPMFGAGVVQDTLLAAAYRVDPVTHEPVVEANYLVPIPATEVPASGSVTTAFYWLDDVAFWPVE